jgi:hypothetical protein
MHLVGSRVVARRAIYDEQPDGRALRVARDGDAGIVEYVDRDGVPTVRWARSGRAVDCLDGDLYGLKEE